MTRETLDDEPRGGDVLDGEAVAFAPRRACREFQAPTRDGAADEADGARLV